jgi:hypothetical protein
VKAVSVSSGILPYFSAPAVAGLGLGLGYIDFGTFVLAVTRPGAPRMPNGVETPVRAERGVHAWLGGGVLRVGGESIEPGEVWEPTPAVVHMPEPVDGFTPEPEALAGRGPGLTPAGDDVLMGYAAALTLFHGLRDEAFDIVRRARPLTTRLSATLLDHAARGELAEPAHDFLGRGDSGPLERFGQSSGRCLKLGLMLGAGLDRDRP